MGFIKAQGKYAHWFYRPIRQGLRHGLQDLRDGGGLEFWVELLFISFVQLESYHGVITGHSLRPLYWNPLGHHVRLEATQTLHREIRDQVCHSQHHLRRGYSPNLRDIINGQGNDAYQEILEDLKALWAWTDKLATLSSVRRDHLILMEQQLMAFASLA